ncbi:MAG: TIGR04190 family B12-binding domain/radical SAM domain protein [Actinobacteria bacterium]|nr:TIGR04190 family B12-binding domain/radical SAM domain protein [Actinomycetota bacterium]MCL5887763.1 TIGR04190 family B12-binding domain/radical SAM domain protein [Actinomycetota bacterium]
MSKIDLVLLHAPSVYDFREKSIMFGPVSDMVPSTPVFEMYPLGFTTIAEYLERHGLRVRIVNLAVLMLNRKDFDVEAAIRDMNPVAFGIDLHWLPHAHGSIEISKIVKKYHPDTPVIFGGLSSSFFHEELISYPSVDYVLRGDSTEEPMTRLIHAIKGKGSVSDIPNLTYKSVDGSMVINPLEWVPDNMNDISLDYSFSMRSVIRYRDMMGSVPFKDWLQYPVCASLTCRGCTHNCVTCGGSAYSFRNHFGRRKVAFRDPELLVRDIENVQKYVPGPIFVLNDFLQGGPDYVSEFIRGLARIKLRNPIGFEFFKPPAEEFYQFLNEHLDDYSVEISAESHDDAVRTAFGKHHYTTAELEESIAAALRNGCSRFDLYFMTGIPTQTAESILETSSYTESLYSKMNNDKRLLVFSSPMAPFLDPGSMVFDDPDKFGFKLRARTLEEHRQLLIEPSWKHIMNYESDAVSVDDLVEATYEVGYHINRVKGNAGIVPQDVAEQTMQRIVEARDIMRRVDAIYKEPAAAREKKLGVLRKEMERLSESTVCEKRELRWPAKANWRHVVNVLALWAKESIAGLFGIRTGTQGVACEGTKSR